MRTHRLCTSSLFFVNLNPVAKQEEHANKDREHHKDKQHPNKDRKYPNKG